jgi:hypothetical protein
MNWVMLPDAIMLENCDSMWAEPGWESSWSHWHSTWRMATLAPQPFLQWLRNIQDQIYPWATRVTLGSHGYHHTPSPDSAWNPFHEFILYQPEEHLERFHVMRDDFAAAGLDTTMITAIRYPGHRTSQSGLMAAIRYGYTFYCNGVRWFEWSGGEPYWNQHLTRFVSPDGTIWGTNTVWWADYASQYPIEYLTSVLDRGKHALTGGHPSQMWFNGDPMAYERVDSICTMMEETPYFGWLLPEEYGSFLDETSRIVFTSIRSTPAGIEAEFTGAAGLGQTLVAEPALGQQVQWVRLDGIPMVWEQRGARVFAFPGPVGGGLHSLRFEYIQTGVEEDPSIQEPQTPVVTASNPFGSSLAFQVTGLAPESVVSCRLIDISGRIADSGSLTADPSGAVQGSIDTSRLPSGVYFLAFESSGHPTSSARLTHLHE